MRKRRDEAREGKSPREIAEEALARGERPPARIRSRHGYWLYWAESLGRYVTIPGDDEHEEDEQ
jgi:hypothetical protein